MLREAVVVGWAVSADCCTIFSSFLSLGVEGDPMGERPGEEIESD